MKKMKRSIVLFVMLSVAAISRAQDPSFAQFFSSPLNVNPALTGNIYGKWRVISNFRNQWMGPGDPYTTGTISADSKIFQNSVNNYVDEMTRVGIGGMMMFDQALGGGLKSNYASFNISGNIRLASTPGPDVNGLRIRHLSKITGDESGEHRLGLGLSVTYGQRKIDVSKLSFEEQFTGNGFDTNLPTGETALSNMKPFVSANAGLVYSYSDGITNFDLGVAGFHLNKPMQTFLQDDKQTLSRRWVVHSNFETFLSDNLVLNTNGIYQSQGGASYWSVGGAFGFYLPAEQEDIRVVTAGLWYWNKNSIIPYVGFRYNDLQVGLSYDVLINDLKDATKKYKTFELSLIFRGGSNEGDRSVIPSPWK